MVHARRRSTGGCLAAVLATAVCGAVAAASSSSEGVSFAADGGYWSPPSLPHRALSSEPELESTHHASRARIVAPTIDEADPGSWMVDGNDNDDDDWSLDALDARPEYPHDGASRETTTRRRRNDDEALALHLGGGSPSAPPAAALPAELKKNLRKTGTTIAGCVCDQHVVLAADTRATQNTVVADKTAQKLHPLSDNAWCAGAGTSADLEMVTRECRYTLALDRLSSTTIGNGPAQGWALRPLRAAFAPDGGNNDDPNDGAASRLLVGRVSVEKVSSWLQEKLFAAQGNLGVNLILGCVSPGAGAQLRAFHPHGSVDADLPFCALGSGGLAAMAVLEQGYSEGLTLDEGIALVRKAIVAGIENDLGSGSQVDLCVIYPDGTSKLQRGIVPPQVLDNDDNDDETAATAGARNQTETTTGTNGFGNTPFGILSRRVLVESDEREVLDDWSNLLLGTTKGGDNGTRPEPS